MSDDKKQIVPLADIAREVRECHETVSEELNRLSSDLKSCGSKAAYAGKLLAEARARMDAQDFDHWVRKNCGMNPHRAGSYLRLARQWENQPEFWEDPGLRAALILRSEEDKNAEPKVKAESWFEAITRLCRFTRFARHEQLATWPESGKAKLVEELEPVVRELKPSWYRPETGGRE